MPGKQLNFGPGISGPGVDNTKTLLPKQNQQPIQKQPTQGRGATNLFSDEKMTYDKMISDGLDDITAKSLITKKRKTLLEDITQDESKVLSQMITDGLDSETAVKVVRKNRYKNLPIYKKALKIPFDASVGATGMATEQVGNLLDFMTGGQFEFRKEGQEAREVGKRTTGDSFAAKAGETILGAGEIASLTPTKTASTLGGRSLQGAAAFGAMGATEPILEKGSDVTPGEIIGGGLKGAAIGAIATPVLEKAVLPVLGKTIQKLGKYGKAGYKGGVPGITKSVTRDITKPFKKVKIEGLAPKRAASLSTKANRFNAKDIEDFQRITKTKSSPLGETPGEFATKRGMNKVGNEAVEETTKLWKASMKEADDALRLIDGNFKVKKGTDYMLEMLDDLSGRLGKTLSKDSKKLNLLKKKYDLKGLSQSEINNVKRIYSRNYKYNWMEAGGEAALRSKNLQDGVRKWQFQVAKDQGFKNLVDINKTTQGWRQFSDSLSKKLKRSSGNNNLSLTDWITLSGGEPTNVAMFLGKKVGEITPVKRALIKGLGKQTKPSIIKAGREGILKSNIKKRATNIDRILRDRISGSSTLLVKKPKPLALPPGKSTKGTKTFIGPSKKPVKLKEITESSRLSKSKTPSSKVDQSFKQTKKPLKLKELDKTKKIIKKKPLKNKPIKTMEKPEIPKEFIGKATVGKTDEGVKKQLTEKGFKQSDMINSKGKIGDIYTKEINGNTIKISHMYKSVKGENMSEISIRSFGKNSDRYGGTTYKTKDKLFDHLKSSEDLYKGNKKPLKLKK